MQHFSCYVSLLQFLSELNFKWEGVIIDGYPAEFWKEKFKKENMGKMITKVMKKICEIG
jgi:hypothetical protein